LVRIELTRCRLRPVLGRLPLLGGGAAAAVGLVVSSGTGPVGPDELAGAIAVASTPGLLVAFVIGAGIAHDLRASGTDATDRTMVGRPTALGLAQIAALATWSALVAAVVAASLALARVVAGAARGRPLLALSEIGPVAASTLQFAAAAGATAAVGFALSRATRSPTAAIGGFLVMLLLGDGVLMSLDHHLALFALPDNLLALGSGRLEGLAVRSESYLASAMRAVVAGAALATAATVIDARRDVH
jgi:hypothetical protein